MREQLRAPLTATATSFGGLRGAHNLAPHYVEKRQPLGQSMEDFPVYLAQSWWQFSDALFCYEKYRALIFVICLVYSLVYLFIAQND